ncbi:Retrovirus-related Pol polyprotein from transposon RE2 [Vitis vinifera]|uniref:Retrovirus-related Pol polyprotein from transposon RE2 n=1 Tax=Vitis vinifera TaxID=29760 RepID=A0A438K525_VITVI|nr:Retrovirus-related Pol polyprotein from transposon RE2 [Vitis vinifera]
MQKMKETKAVKDYTDKLLMLANKIRMLGEEFSDTREVEKILEEIIEETFQVKEVDQAQGGNKGKKQWSKKSNKKGENSNSGGNQGKHPPCPYWHANSCGIWKGSSSSDDWLLDSGCTKHMSFDESLFNKVNKSEVSKVRIGNGQYKESVAIKGSAGYSVVFKNKMCVLANSNGVKKDLVRGMTYNRGGAAVCGVCQLRKQARLSFPVNKAWRAVEKLQLIHTDVCGPMRTASLSGNSSKHGLKIKVAIELRLPTKALKGKTPFEVCLTKGYRIYQPLTKKIVSRDVKFDEATRWNWDKAEPEQVYTEEKEPELQVDDVIDDKPIRGYDEAIKDPKWIAAMEDEIKMIHKNQIWELVDRPLYKKAIGVKWVFRTKLNVDGSINKYKWRIYQLDVKSTFLNGYLEEEIFVEQPEDFVADPEKVYLLKKELYGFKQAPRAWYSRIDEHLKKKGFNKSISESTLIGVKAQMMQAFEMTDLGEMAFFLGLEIQQLQQGIFIEQQKYAKEVLKKFNMKDCICIVQVSCIIRLLRGCSGNVSRMYDVWNASHCPEKGAKSLTAYFMDFKKVYEELNALMPFSPDVRVQQAQREQMVVMSFLSGLPSKFETAKSQILSSFDIGSLQEVFSRVLRTENVPSSQHTNVLAAKKKMERMQGG